MADRAWRVRFRGYGWRLNIPDAITFTLPEELRALFFTPSQRAMYEMLFAAAASALAATLANPRWLGAQKSGFTMILHTWNQRLLFHPHLHGIVPGAGLEAAGRIVSVASPGFLVPLHGKWHLRVQCESVSA